MNESLMSNKGEGKLIERMFDAEAELAPEDWVDQYADQLYRYAIVRVGKAELAEELVQETFLAGLKGAQRYSGAGTPAAWLHGILKRKIIDYYRKSGRQANIAEDDESAMNQIFDSSGNWRNEPKLFGDRPSQSIENLEFWESFYSCLEGLPTRQANAFKMREVDDLKSDDICQQLEISSTNLWVLLHRARLRLAKCLQQKLNLEGGVPS